jgi:DNA transformation protein and related proteins
MTAPRSSGRSKPGESIAYIIDLLRGWSLVDARRMFSGYGLFRDGLMFGIVIRDVLHFKTDDDNRGAYEAAGMAPFQYRRGEKRVALGYHAVPAEALDDADTLVTWADKAYAAAMRKAVRSRKRKPARGKRTTRGRHR